MSSFSEQNKYWIPNLDISKKVITTDIQYYLGPGTTVRPYTREGEEGFLITTPGDCLTDEQIDDICKKSKELWDKQAAALAMSNSDKQLKRPLHQPILVSRGFTIEGNRRGIRNNDRENNPRRRSTDRRSSSRW